MMKRMKKIVSVFMATIMLIACVPTVGQALAEAASAEYAYFPGSVLRVTQGAYGEYNSYSHNGQGGYYQNAFDLGGNANYCAPFSGTITKIKTSYNAVVLQSDAKVYWANGDYDYMSVTFVHDNDISNLYVGKHINQGEVFYQPGIKDPGGWTTGTHLHICVNKGLTNSGISYFTGDVRPNEAFFLKSSTSIVQTGNYNWRTDGAQVPSYSTIAKGDYVIKHNASGRYLDVYECANVNGQNVQVYPFNGTTAQWFEILESPATGGYSARPACSTTRMLNVYASTVSSGKNVCIWDNTGHNSQRWFFEKKSGGYVIRNVQNTGCVLDVSSDYNVYVNTDSGSANQLWSVQNTIQYNANGGSDAPGQQFKNYGEAATLSTKKPVRSGYEFVGWAKSSTATSAQYSAGGQFADNANTVLYAVWRKATYRVASVTLSSDVFVYDGKAKTPAVTVKNTAGKTLVNGTDYTVSYPVSRKALGVYTVTVNMKGNYSGTKTLNFVITLATPTVKIANASKGVKVTWNKIAGASGYIVYRRVYSGGKWSGWTKLGKVTATSYGDTTVKSGATVKYTVRAYYGSSKSAYKASAATQFLAMPTVKIANASKGVKVTWNKIAGASGYIVYRRVYSGGKWSGWTKLGKVTATSYGDTKVKSGTTVQYTVRAYRGSYASTYKASATTKFLAQPSTKVTKTSTSLKATWSKAAGATGYIVYRRTYSKGKWSNWTILTKTKSLSYNDKAAKKGVNYQYAVRAYNGSYKSSYTASKTTKR